jgi:hypothetical protein
MSLQFFFIYRRDSKISRLFLKIHSIALRNWGSAPNPAGGAPAVGALKKLAGKGVFNYY